MEEARVLAIINGVSLGNNNLRTVMRSVYGCGKDIIDTWPEEDTGKLIRRTLKATSLLIHERIGIDEMMSLRENYWKSENGKRVDLALARFVEARIKPKAC